MEAFAALPGIRAVCLPRGKLSVHEEFPDATFDVVAPFLRAALGTLPDRSIGSHTRVLTLSWFGQ